MVAYASNPDHRWAKLVYLTLGFVGDGIEEQKVHYICLSGGLIFLSF